MDGAVWTVQGGRCRADGAGCRVQGGRFTVDGGRLDEIAHTDGASDCVRYALLVTEAKRLGVGRRGAECARAALDPSSRALRGMYMCMCMQVQVHVHASARKCMHA